MTLQDDVAALKSSQQQILSRLNKISTADGKVRSDGDGTHRTGVQRKHTHIGTGEGGLILDGNVPNWLFVGGARPTVNDDTTLGYHRGSQWIDNRVDQLYVCVRADTGAAVWRTIGSASSFSSLPPVRIPLPWGLHLPSRWIYRRRPVVFYS